MNNKFFINLYLALLIFSSLAAIELPRPIVDVKWLKENISDVQVVNVRVDLDNLYSEPKFNQDPVLGKKTVVQVGGHIENSYVLDYRGARDSRIIGGKEAQFLIPVKEKFIDYVQSAGINRDKPIVIVAKGDSAPDIFRALRVFWEFKVYGQDDVVFLDGGMVAWLSESMPYVTKKTARDRGNWTAKAFNTSLIASTDEVKKLSDSRSSKKNQANLSLENLLLDARAPSQFYGIAKRPYISKYGHIPGAINYSLTLRSGKFFT
jgi:thiosulfate/3-mercaptopyruvate sulfurtransferase